MKNKIFLITFLFLLTLGCSLGEKAPVAADGPTVEGGDRAPTAPALGDSGACGDGLCSGPETAQSCPQDCPKSESESESAPAQANAEIPASVFVVHCEPTTANEHSWGKLVELVDLANTYNVPLSIDFTAQWAEMVSDDWFKTKAVESWQENGHEIGSHHHAYWATKEHGSTWDGYTNTPKDELDPQDQKKYLGNMEDYMALLNALPGERSSGAMGSTGSPKDEIDWPCQIQYGTTGHLAEDGSSQPQQVTIGNCQVTQIGHALIVPQKSGALAEQYANTDPDSIFGVVGHAFNYDEFPAAFEEWFKFLHEQDPRGEHRYTVSGILGD